MQVLVNGLVAGLTVSLLALAFALVYLPARVFHVAQGAVYTAVPFVAWSCLQRGWPFPMAWFVALLAGMGLSLVCEEISHWRLERKGASDGAQMIASLGLYIVIVQGVALLWGTNTKVLRVGLDRSLQAGGVTLTGAQLLTVGLSVLALGSFFLWLWRTKLGLQYRALADNPVELALRGYSVRQLRLVAFALSGLLTALAALVAANDVGFDPNGGLAMLLLAVVAVIIGGRRSFLGVVLGGAVLGLVRSGVAWYLSARWVEAATFLLLTTFLFLRPNGLFGRSGRVEADA